MPRAVISVAHFLTVADVERSARYYEKVLRRAHSNHGWRKRTSVSSTCEYLDDSERGRRADPGPADGNAQRSRPEITSTAL